MIGNDLDVASYAFGRWTMFKLISSRYYGKECYFMQYDGVVYSRISSSYLANMNEAVKEFLGYMGGE